MIWFFISQIFLCIAIVLIFFLLENNRKITDIQSEMIWKLVKFDILQNKINNWQDEEISQIQEKLEFLEKKQVEMRANICLQNRRIDQIFAEKLSQDEYTEGLEVISEDFEKSEQWEKDFEIKIATEIEAVRTEFAKITKSQHRRIVNLEIMSGEIPWVYVGESEKIFNK